MAQFSSADSVAKLLGVRRGPLETHQSRRGYHYHPLSHIGPSWLRHLSIISAVRTPQLTPEPTSIIKKIKEIRKTTILAKPHDKKMWLGDELLLIDLTYGFRHNFWFNCLLNPINFGPTDKSINCFFIFFAFLF